MDLLPRLLGTALVGFALAASGSASFAGGEVPGSAEAIASLPPSQDFLLPADDKSALTAQPQPEVQDGYLNFFSVRPESKSGDFTSLLGNSASGGGLRLHFNW